MITKWAVFCLVILLFCGTVSAQVSPKVAAYLKELRNDPQFNHAHIGWCVANVEIGTVLSAYNSEDMFIPASTLKTITAAYALEKLGDTFHFRTAIYYDVGPDKIKLLVRPSGDPTLGSHRFAITQPDTIWHKVYSTLDKIADAKPVCFPLMTLGNDYAKPINDGWMWCDIANYYSAPAMSLNWRENFYTLHFNTVNPEGNLAELLYSSCADSLQFDNKVTCTYLNNTDEAYIYYDLSNPKKRTLTGTLPAGRKDFTVKGVDACPALSFSSDGYRYLKAKLRNTRWDDNADSIGKGMKVLDVITSPPLSDIVRQMLKHSINLYAEALAASDNGFLAANSVQKLKKYTSGILHDSLSFKIYDACGLSPLDRVTPSAMCHILNYAERKHGAHLFHTYLNETNMGQVSGRQNTYYIKDGYINGVRSIVGYCRSYNGKFYSFSLFVNDIQSSGGDSYDKVEKLINLILE